MNRIRALTALLLPLILIGALRAQSLTEGEPVPGLVLVKFAPDASPQVAQRIEPTDLQDTQARSVLQAAGLVEGRKVFREFLPADTLAMHRMTGEPVALIDLSRWYLLRVDDDVDVEDLAQQLKALPGVEAATPEYPVVPFDVLPNDPAFQQGLQWGLRNLSYPGRDIHAPEAWEFNTGRSDVIVAVIDGGIDYNHLDLDPGNRSRVIAGYDTADNDSDPMDDIPSGQNFADHGTPIAGIIGAITNNNRDVAGVMWDVKIMPVKIAYTNGPWWDPYQIFSGPGSAFRTDIGQGIEYARTNGANIINLSLGSPASQAPGTFEEWFIGNPIGEAIFNSYRQGVLVFAASGNDSQSEVGYPANHPLAIAVGNSTNTDTRRSSSNYGDRLDFVAPGSGYRSTTRGGGITPNGINGTSFASPMAAGVAGLVLSESRDLGLNLTNDDIREILRRSADDLGPAGFDVEYGYGRVNAAAALAMINAPNTVTHLTRTGGTSTLDWNSHTHTFINGAYGDGGYVASGTYHGVKQYVVTGHVTFSPAYQQTPQVWFRPRQTKGFGFGNPNNQAPSVQITNLTRFGFDYETVVFYIGTNSNGQQVNTYVPASPAQVRVEFTVVGQRPPLSVGISGPSTVVSGQPNTWTSVVSGGTTPYARLWEYLYVCSSGGGGGCSGSPSVCRPEDGDPANGSSAERIVPPLPSGVTSLGPYCDTWSSGGTTNTFTHAFAGAAQGKVRLTVTDGSGTTRSSTRTVNIGSSRPGGEAITDASNGTDATAARGTAGASGVGAALPETYVLDGVAPNPFRGTTSVGFALPEEAEVRLTVYDLLGREGSAARRGAGGSRVPPRALRR